MGHHSTLSGSGYVGLAAMTAANLEQALIVLTQFEHLNSQCYRGTSTLITEESKPVLSFYSIAPYNAYTCFVVDGVLTAWVKLIYLLTGRTDLVELTQIEFDAPSYSDAYTEAFPCPVRFGCERNALILSAEALTVPLLESNSNLHNKLVQQCELLLNEIALADSYRNKVLKVLGTMLHGQTPSIDEVALKLGMPSWTLRRKLKEEDSAYQLLVDEMRRDVAMSYMRNTDLTFGEISYLLGFSTPGAFQRAFKRWSGQTPGEYRKSLSSKRK
jgi:AraC-like DNA-binding protein